mmetsp:Transcript_17919/g.42223  ORF Transcript_17919/g.42223 Transcript_17919/m.42223 type:complete len:228 (-) Transcript_17919:3948-4631(-)
MMRVTSGKDNAKGPLFEARSTTSDIETIGLAGTPAGDRRTRELPKTVSTQLGLAPLNDSFTTIVRVHITQRKDRFGRRASNVVKPVPSATSDAGQGLSETDWNRLLCRVLTVRIEVQCPPNQVIVGDVQLKRRCDPQFGHGSAVQDHILLVTSCLLGEQKSRELVLSWCWRGARFRKLLGPRTPKHPRVDIHHLAELVVGADQKRKLPCHLERMDLGLINVAVAASK